MMRPYVKPRMRTTMTSTGISGRESTTSETDDNGQLPQVIKNSSAGPPRKRKLSNENAPVKASAADDRELRG